MGEPEPEQKPKRPKPSLDEEARMLGYVRRLNKPVYDALEDYARQTGRKKTLVIQEALSHFLLERKAIQSEMTVAELYEALQFLVELQQWAIKNFLDFAKFFLSEEYQGLLELSRVLRPISEAFEGYGLEEAKEVKEEKPSKEPEEMLKIRQKLWQTMEPFLDMMLEAYYNSMAQFFSKMFPQAKLSKPEFLKAKIPVTIEVEGEKEAETPTETQEKTEQ